MKFMRLKASFLVYLSLVYIFPVANECQGGEWDSQGLGNKPKKSRRVEQPKIFNKYHLVTGVTRNYPAFYSVDRFTQGVWHPILTFRYFLSDEWYMGFSGHYKFLIEKEGQTDLAIASLSQELSYVYRIYHPMYLTLGERLHYLNPTRRGMLPMQKHSGYSVEIGASMALGLLFRFEQGHIFEIVFSRWRGTKTMQLHGYEFQLSFGWKV